MTRELWDSDEDRRDRESRIPRDKFVMRPHWGHVCTDCEGCRALINRSELQLALNEGRIDSVRASGLREVSSSHTYTTWCTQHRALTLVQWTSKVSNMALDAGAPWGRKRRQWPANPIAVGVRRMDLPSAWGEDIYLPSQQWQPCPVESAEIVTTISSESTITSIGAEIGWQLNQVYERVWGVP
jgi:hypothetical protein